MRLCPELAKGAVCKTVVEIPPQVRILPSALCITSSIWQSKALLMLGLKVQVLRGVLYSSPVWCNWQHASLWHLQFGIVLRHWDKLLFVSITVVQVTLNHLMLVRFQHEQLLQEYRHTHEAHIFVAVGSAPIPATNSPSPINIL